MSNIAKFLIAGTVALIIALIAGAAAFLAMSGHDGPVRVVPVAHDVDQVDAGPSSDVLPTKNQPAAALFGYKPQPNATRQFLATMEKPTLRQAAPELFQARGPPTKAVLLYRALYKAHQDTFKADWVCPRQGIGDCVSFGWAHGADVHLAIMYLRGDSAKWKPVATESIYGGSRVEARGRSLGGYSDGSYGGAAAKWIREHGLIFREEYDVDGLKVDLTKYSSARAKDWGNFGNGGRDDNGRLDREAKKSPVRDVALVRNFEEAAAAIESGYPIPVCSGQGFSSRRDDQGFSRPSGSWSHCMCFTAVRYDRRGLLCQNSWGPGWVDGPKWPEDQPDGSFWVDEATVNHMLRGQDSFSVSGYGGFPFKPINNTDWVRAHQPEETIYALAP